MALDLSRCAHRSPPPPRRGWSIFMRWHDLLFAHWRVEPAVLRPLVPPGLAIDTFEGEAWLGVVPFTMSGIRHRLLPPCPRLSAFPELNVRTYVTCERDGRPGVWFFSLDASSAIAVRTARWRFGLAYMSARMAVTRRDGWVHYESRRTGPFTSLAYGAAATAEAGLRASYRPVGEPLGRRAGPLEAFLTDRWCLYAWKRGCLVRGEIHHEPWTLHAAEARIEGNTMGGPLGMDLARMGQPVLHYSPGLDVAAWTPDRV